MYFPHLNKIFYHNVLSYLRYSRYCNIQIFYRYYLLLLKYGRLSQLVNVQRTTFRYNYEVYVMNYGYESIFGSTE